MVLWPDWALAPTDRARKAPTARINDRMARSVAGQQGRRAAGRRAIVGRRRGAAAAVDVAAIVGPVRRRVRRRVRPARERAGVRRAADRRRGAACGLVLTEIGETVVADAEPDRVD